VTARASRQVVLSLGSNLGDRLACLQRAIDFLCNDQPGAGEHGRPGPAGELAAIAVSGVYETAPVGGPAQDDYLNAVLLASTTLSCPEVLERGQAAEAALHRVRVQRWGPRTLDVDVIACGDEQSADPRLTLPHPRAAERAFVLAPWLDVAPDAVLPGRGRVADLLSAVGTAGVRRRGDLVLTLPGTGSATGPAAPPPAPPREPAP
jgi:2-amino-4-hydroxy-6-hydroxymethyldihydropteridine diphosphokinase